MEDSKEFSDFEMDAELTEAGLSALRELFISRMYVGVAVETLKRFE